MSLRSDSPDPARALKQKPVDHQVELAGLSGRWKSLSALFRRESAK